MGQTRTLTAKQQTFANLYALGNLSAVEAARQAGYTENTALIKSHAWLDKVSIRNAITLRKQELAEVATSSDSILSPEFIMKRTAELATQTENPSAAVSALRLGADIMGMTGGGQAELPEALSLFLEAAARGMLPAVSEPKAIEATPLDSADS